MEHTKHAKLTSEVRDTILRLSKAGLKLAEIAEILNVSYSITAYTMQCYRAVESDDWETVHKISDKQGQCIKWALNRLGKTLPEENAAEPDCVETSSAPVCAEHNAIVAYENILKSFNRIESILSEILAELKG